MSAKQTQSEPKPSSSSNTNTKYNSRLPSTYSSEFEEIYEQYPRKEGKKPGHRIYHRDIKTPEDRDLLLKAIKNYTTKKAGTESQYLKHFGTFMGEWRDWAG